MNKNTKDPRKRHSVIILYLPKITYVTKIYAEYMQCFKCWGTAEKMATEQELCQNNCDV